MLSYHRITCPFCGECFEIGVDPGAQGKMIQDCDVCCRPICIEVLQSEASFGEDSDVPLEDIAHQDPFDAMFHRGEQRVLVTRGS